MVSQQNPFTPGWGTQPPVVVGRQELLSKVGDVYANPGWSRYSNLSLIARRGIGKTVLLSEFHHLATDEGWLVITDSAGRTTGSFVDRIAASLNEFVASRKPQPGRRLTGGSASALGFSFGLDAALEDTGDQSLDLRRSLDEVMGMGPDRPAGILMTVDEVHKATEADINDFGNVVQLLQNEGQPVAVALAGLPVKEGKEPTFLARCKAIRMLDLADTDIELGLIHTAGVAGLTFDREALDMGVQAAAGHPFMMQLVGWHACELVLGRGGDVVATEDVFATLDEARDEFKQAVLKSIGVGLSKIARVVLAAMAIDSGPSEVKALQHRLGRDPQTVNRYLTRLAKAELVHRVGRGVYDFTVPGHRAEMRGSEEYQVFQDIEAERVARVKNRPSPSRGLER